MNLLDLRTVVFSFVIINAICLIMMAFWWFQNHDRFRGFGFWLAGFVVQFAGILLVTLRGIVPDFLSVVVSTTFVFAGLILLYIGLERFVDKRASQLHNYLVLGAFLFVQSYFVFVQPSPLLRTVILLGGIIFICLQCAWLLIRRMDADLRPITRGTGYIFLTFCLVSFASLIAILVVGPDNNFFKSGTFDVLAVLISQALFTILSFGLWLIVGGRQVAGLEREITERKQVEEFLRRRNDILVTSQQVMLDLVNQYNQDAVLETVLVKIGALLDVSDISINLVENDDTLVTYAATPEQPLVKGGIMRHAENGWLSWKAIETMQPAILEDASLWSQSREGYADFPIHALAIIPIHYHDQVIGTMNLSRREADKPFDDTDVYVAGQLSQMAALVVDNAKLYAQLQSELAERKRAEDNHRESRENFQRYFNMSTVGMCVISPDRRWVEANGRLRQMLGYSAEELDNLTWSELTHPDDLNVDLRLFNQVLDNQRDSYQLDKRFIRKDGAIVYTTSYVSCYRNPNGSVRYFLASLVDITSRKLAEESLLKLAAIEERQRLARDLHDSVNQSIHGLVLFSETLVSTLEKNNPNRVRQIADRLQESARQALKETRLMLYEMQTTDPERSVNLIKDLETRLVTVERRAGVKAHIFQEGSLDDCPGAWQENLFWITIEALNNALKHAQARNMQINIRCMPNTMELEVIDDGIGFDPDKPRVGGLGLPNMRDRARLLGGELTILSTPQKGTCIRFRAQVKEYHGQDKTPDRR